MLLLTLLLLLLLFIIIIIFSIKAVVRRILEAVFEKHFLDNDIQFSKVLIFIFNEI
jgi:hypothetical protein